VSFRPYRTTARSAQYKRIRDIHLLDSFEFFTFVVPIFVISSRKIHFNRPASCEDDPHEQCDHVHATHGFLRVRRFHGGELLGYTLLVKSEVQKGVILTVLVSALGYFVDIYDLLLFGIVRVPSLRAIGVPEDQMMTVGLRLLNFQMAGMLAGGIVWGVLGDLFGRKSVLFGSILLYSLANIANAFVHSPEVYAWLRLAAGVGLAGELGAAICLVSEVMKKETRGIGTTVVASVGILGAVLGSLIGDFFSWKIAYLVGGGMGLALLVLRAGLAESNMFRTMEGGNVIRGQFHKLFANGERMKRYLCCILIGVPIWYCIGILVTFAPELSRAVGVAGVVTASKSIMWSYVGLSIGDLCSGLLSQWWRSRKKAVLAFVSLNLALIFVYYFQSGYSVAQFYLLCFAIGFATGYWAVFVTIAAEQFGTNIRATVSITVPNFVRGSVVPVTLSFEYLRHHMPTMDAVLTVGLVTSGLAFAALYFLKETYGKDLDYYETL
jgi:MFS family permease